MTLNEYQRGAFRTAFGLATGRKDPLGGLVYCALAMNGEAGEFAEKVKKAWRDDASLGDAAAKELGDVLWYLAVAAGDLGYTLEDIARMNLEKLDSRRGRDTLHGSGDDR
jgi:NTP pyrophosphatase (non-canonical NTP hydrolase)